MNKRDSLFAIDTANNYAKALRQIAEMPFESNEWDGTEKYRNCRHIAQLALGWTPDDPHAPSFTESEENHA